VITHPEKLVFPDDGITKGELAAYYETIAPYMLPHLTRRPITMERYQRGIAAEGFFQKDVTKGFPKWLERLVIPLLFLQSERDFQITMEDFGLWKTGLAGSPQANFRSYPGLNHFFIAGEGRPSPTD
jgi:hypothetical protein